VPHQFAKGESGSAAFLRVLQCREDSAQRGLRQFVLPHLAGEQTLEHLLRASRFAPLLGKRCRRSGPVDKFTFGGSLPVVLNCAAAEPVLAAPLEILGHAAEMKRFDVTQESGINSGRQVDLLPIFRSAHISRREREKAGNSFLGGAGMNAT
jgi:hypothetical protein